MPYVDRFICCEFSHLQQTWISLNYIVFSEMCMMETKAT